MKHIFTTLCFIMSVTLNAQTKYINPKTPAPILADIEKVAADYFNHFDGIKGEKISETPNIVEYASKINPVGALESTIMQIKSLDNCYSWEALMLDTEKYEEAVSKYKLLYKQLLGAKINFDKGQSFRLTGTYDTPDESRSFASSIFGIETRSEELKRFKVEVALSYSMPEWSVKLYLYEKENDEDIRPTVNNDY
ncbi:MAG: hypothetical protein ABIO82_07950 [Ginsengibacter sp.]